jgi:predicted  nucleic acid-binding Zn-ribbon protein
MERQKIEISEKELEALQDLVKSIASEVKETKEKIAKLEKSLEFLNLVLQNLLEE